MPRYIYKSEKNCYYYIYLHNPHSTYDLLTWQKLGESRLGGKYYQNKKKIFADNSRIRLHSDSCHKYLRVDIGLITNR